MDLKVLFITYYWPPAGGVSVQRILHFVNNLCELGVKCHVIHPENASYYQVDSSLQEQLKQEVVTHSVPIKDLTSLIKRIPGQGKEGNIKSTNGSIFSRFLKKIRANYFIPDPKINWVKPVVSKAQKLIAQENFDLIFTNGTPHSVHLTGLRISQMSQIPWVADFRDPWTRMDNFEYLPLNTSALRKHQILERKVIQNADLTLTVSQSWAEEFRDLGAKRSAHITNGFDQIIDKKVTPEFIVSHVGSIHTDRDLSGFIHAFANASKNEKSKHQSWKLALIGNVDSNTIKLAKDKIPDNQLLLTGLVNHDVAKDWIAKSSALLLPINNSKANKGRIPAKLFEYLSSGTPIILLGKNDGDAAKILTECKAGKAFGLQDSNEIEEYLMSIAAGNHNYDPTSKNIQKYSRKNTAIELLEFMKELQTN